MIMAATGKSKYKSGFSSVFSTFLDKELELQASVGSGEASWMAYSLIFMLFLKYTVSFEDTVMQIMSGFASPVIAILSYWPESTITKVIGAAALQ